MTHLVRLVRIKRLVDLGFSLPQIAALGDGDDHPEQALRELDAELAATIDRLQRARDELAELLDQLGTHGSAARFRRTAARSPSCPTRIAS